MIDTIKSLSDQNRIKIVQALSHGTLCVCEIEKSLKLSQNLISHHLAVLKQAGIVENCRCGKKHFYSLNKNALLKLVQEISHLAEK